MDTLQRWPGPTRAVHPCRAPRLAVVGCCAGGSALLPAEGPRSPALEGGLGPHGDLERTREAPPRSLGPAEQNLGSPLVLHPAAAGTEGNPQRPFEPLSRFWLECFLGFVELEKGSYLVLVVLL